MEAEEYGNVLAWLNLNHAQAGRILGVTGWASSSWKNGRRGVPPFIELALRALIYDRVAGEFMRREVDRIVSEAKAGKASSADE